MPVIAGDAKIVTYSHPELGDRVFEAKSGEDVTYQKGGYKSNDDDGNIGTNGTRIQQLNRYPWSQNLTLLENEGDADYLQNASQSSQEGTLTVEYMDSTIRTGIGNPVGDIEPNKQAGTISVKFAGSGTFELI